MEIEKSHSVQRLDLQYEQFRSMQKLGKEENLNKGFITNDNWDKN